MVENECTCWQPNDSGQLKNECVLALLLMPVLATLQLQVFLAKAARQEHRQRQKEAVFF
jgi:hypothetical protein